MTNKIKNSSQSGYALMTAVFMMLGVVAITMAGFLQMGRLQGGVYRDTNRVETKGVAESVLEMTVSQIRDYAKTNGRFPRTNELNQIETDTRQLFNTNQSMATRFRINDLNISHEQFRDLRIDVSINDTKSKADVSLRQKVRLQPGLSPIYDYAVIFDEDLEIASTADTTMSLQGPIHANGDIYMATGPDSRFQLINPYSLDALAPIKFRNDYLMKTSENIYFYYKPLMAENYLKDQNVLYQRAINSTDFRLIESEMIMGMSEEDKSLPMVYYPKDNSFQDHFLEIQNVPNPEGKWVSAGNILFHERFGNPATQTVIFGDLNTIEFPTFTPYYLNLSKVAAQDNVKMIPPVAQWPAAATVYSDYNAISGERQFNFSTGEMNTSVASSSSDFNEAEGLVSSGAEVVKLSPPLNPAWESAKFSVFKSNVGDKRNGVKKVEIPFGDFSTPKARHLMIEPIKLSFVGVSNDGNPNNDFYARNDADAIKKLESTADLRFRCKQNSNCKKYVVLDRNGFPINSGYLKKYILVFSRRPDYRLGLPILKTRLDAQNNILRDEKGNPKTYWKYFNAYRATLNLDMWRLYNAFKWCASKPREDRLCDVLAPKIQRNGDGTVVAREGLIIYVETQSYKTNALTYDEVERDPEGVVPDLGWDAEDDGIDETPSNETGDPDDDINEEQDNDEPNLGDGDLEFIGSKYPVRQIRVRNAAKVPDAGLTVITNGRLWIKGDVNIIEKGKDVAHPNNWNAEYAASPGLDDFKVRMLLPRWLYTNFFGNNAVEANCKLNGKWPDKCNLAPVALISDSVGFVSMDWNNSKDTKIVRHDGMVNAAIITGYLPSGLEKKYPLCNTVNGFGLDKCLDPEWVGNLNPSISNDSYSQIVKENPADLDNPLTSTINEGLQLSCPDGLRADGTPKNGTSGSGLATCDIYRDVTTGVVYLRRIAILKKMIDKMIVQYNDYESWYQFFNNPANLPSGGAASAYLPLKMAEPTLATLISHQNNIRNLMGTVLDWDAAAENARIAAKNAFALTNYKRTGILGDNRVNGFFTFQPYIVRTGAIYNLLYYKGDTPETAGAFTRYAFNANSIQRFPITKPKYAVGVDKKPENTLFWSPNYTLDQLHRVLRYFSENLNRPNYLDSQSRAYIREIKMTFDIIPAGNLRIPYTSNTLLTPDSSLSLEPIRDRSPVKEIVSTPSLPGLRWGVLKADKLIGRSELKVYPGSDRFSCTVDNLLVHGAEVRKSAIRRYGCTGREAVELAVFDAERDWQTLDPIYNTAIEYTEPKYFPLYNAHYSGGLENLITFEERWDYGREIDFNSFVNNNLGGAANPALDPVLRRHAQFKLLGTVAALWPAEEMVRARNDAAGNIDMEPAYWDTFVTGHSVDEGRERLNAGSNRDTHVTRYQQPVYYTPPKRIFRYNPKLAYESPPGTANEALTIETLGTEDVSPRSI